MLLARVFGGSLVMRLDRVRLVGAELDSSERLLCCCPPLIDFWQWC